MKGGTETYLIDVLNINKKYILNYDIIRLIECTLEETNILLNNDNKKLLLNDNFLMDKNYDIIHIHYINN